jgi:hypothetical protein
MASSYAIDRAGSLGKLQRTGMGGYRVPATIARTGILVYGPEQPLPGRHYTPPDVLAASAQDALDVPVTNRHPPTMVNPQNYQKFAAGHVIGTPSFDGSHVHAVLAIQDAQLLQAVESGACREVSMGYGFEYDATPGTTPEGEAYDIIRTAIHWNHIALVPEGRAGSSVSCVLDSVDIPTEGEPVLYTIDGAEVAQDKTQATIDAVCAARDAAVAEAASLAAKLSAACSAEAIDAAVKTRLDAIDAAKAAELALAQAAERRAVVARRFPTIALDGKSQDYVDGLYEIASATDGLPAPAVPVVVTDAAPVLSAREQMLAANRARKPASE